MAGNDVIYTKSAVFVNGNQFLQMSDITVTVRNNAQKVETLGIGLAGMSPGSPEIEVTLTNMIPAAGFEFDPTQAIINLTQVELAFNTAGRTLTTKGFFMDNSVSQAVNKAAEQKLTFIGSPAVYN